MLVHQTHSFIGLPAFSLFFWAIFFRRFLFPKDWPSDGIVQDESLWLNKIGRPRCTSVYPFSDFEKRCNALQSWYSSFKSIITFVNSHEFIGLLGNSEKFSYLFLNSTFRDTSKANLLTDNIATRWNIYSSCCARKTVLQLRWVFGRGSWSLLSTMLENIFFHVTALVSEFKFSLTRFLPVQAGYLPLAATDNKHISMISTFHFSVSMK